MAAVSVGWGGYLKSLLDSLFGIKLPDSIAARPATAGRPTPRRLPRARGAGAAHLRRARERAHEHVHGLVKVAILIFFVVVGVGSINGDNFSPWAPHGFNGTVDAAALIFFAYIGFDAISTYGEEAENPSRDLPSRSSARC